MEPMPQNRDGVSDDAGRVRLLDGLRGICAAIVFVAHLVGHVYQSVPLVPGLNWLWNGSNPVVIFFTISGFVLVGAWRQTPSWPRFILRRFVRLYPPFIATVLGSALVAPLWIPGTTPGEIGRAVFDLALLRDVPHLDIDRPLWSILQEFRLVLLFPLVLAAIGRWGGLAVPGFAALATVVMLVPGGDDETGPYYRLTVCLTCVSAGIWMTQARPRLSRLYARLPAAAKLAAAAVLAYVLSGLSESYDIALWWKWTIYAACAAVMAWCLVSPLCARVLERPIPQFLGRISFSLYLVHGPVMDTIYPRLAGLSRPLACAGATAASLAVAFIWYRLLERPSIRLSRRLAAVPRKPRSTAEPAIEIGQGAAR